MNGAHLLRLHKHFVVNKNIVLYFYIYVFVFVLQHRPAIQHIYLDGLNEGFGSRFLGGRGTDYERNVRKSRGYNGPNGCDYNNICNKNI